MEGTKPTGLWKNKSKAGKNYIAGNLGLVRVLVLPNDFKNEEKDPDYNLWLVPRKPKDKENGEDIPF